jgi:hypothetical protein
VQKRMLEFEENRSRRGTTWNQQLVERVCLYKVDFWLAISACLYYVCYHVFLVALFGDGLIP